MHRRIGAALLLATGCRGFPCTDDIGFPDDETFISFVPAETRWNEGAYRVEITLDEDVFACAFAVPVERASTCTEGLRFAESGLVPDDPRSPNEMVVSGSVPEDEIRVTVELDGDVVVDEVITDFVRDDEQAKDGRKVCAEWSRVLVDVPAP